MEPVRLRQLHQLPPPLPQGDPGARVGEPVRHHAGVDADLPGQLGVGQAEVGAEPSEPSLVSVAFLEGCADWG
jgi:hypothetical protein